MTIGIYGCGWLGEGLAIHFLNQQKSVIGSTTTKEKLPYLSTLKVQPLLLNITDHVECNNLQLLSAPDIFIINIPPKLKDRPRGSHLLQIQKLYEKIYDPNKKYIFVSSTSVYGELQGEVDEETPCGPTSPQGEELLSVESFIMNKDALNTTIVRFGGLIDENRHPAKHLSGRKGLTDAEASVNLIHKADCIGILNEIISEKKWGEIYNGVCDEHTSRKDFYTSACKKRGLPIPEFIDSEVYKNYKQVSNQKIRLVLKYNFLFPRLLQY